MPSLFSTPRPLHAASLLAIAATAALTACGGGGSTGALLPFTPTAPAPAPAPAAPQNQSPVASARADALGLKGVAATLDGSASSDADGDALQYSWTVVSAPGGSHAAFSNAAAAAPTFTPDVAGSYEFALVVNDGKVNSAPSKVKVNVGAVAFDTIPTPLPLSAPSFSFDASQLANVGDLVTLDASTPRGAFGMEVVLVSWACETGVWTGACATTPGATFTHPVTVRIRDAAGLLLAERTQTVTIPYRPSTDPTCATPTNWRGDDGNCRSGRSVKVAFDLHDLNVTLPDTVRYEVAFNTQHFGSSPLGVTGPYDSLNVAASSTAPTVGIDLNSNEDYENGVPTVSGGFGVMAQIITGVPQH